METKVDQGVEKVRNDTESLIYEPRAEVNSYDDLMTQRGTAIPALFNQFYKFVQNPSSVSVDTFKRMVDTDDTVGSGVDFLTTCLAARMGRYQHKNKEITEWVNTALESMDNGWVNAMKEMLAATWVGFNIAEKVWANTENGFVIQKLVSYPPQTILFETDRTGELTNDGILQYQRNYNPALYNSGANYFFGFVGIASQLEASYRPDAFAKLGDLPFPMRTSNMFTYMSIRIPKLKCVHYAFDAQGKFGNPYGRSLLRRGYKFWVTKDAILQMMATALDRKGTPLTIVYADPNMTLLDNEKQQQGTNMRGQKAGIRADVAAQKAFQNVHNDSVIILPGKKGQIYEHDTIQQSSNAGDFIEALRFCNQSLLRALLIPSLIFGNGDGSGSFALGQEHARTFDKILDGILSGFKQVCLQQIVKELIAYNFPKSAWVKEGLGDFSKRELTQEERDKEMETIEKAVNMGAIDINDLNDLNAIREKAGFEARNTPIPQPVNPFGDEGEGGEPGEEKEGDENGHGNEGGDQGSKGGRKNVQGNEVRGPGK